MNITPDEFLKFSPQETFLLFEAKVKQIKGQEINSWERIRTLAFFIETTKMIDRKTPLSYPNFCKKSMPFSWDDDIDDDIDDIKEDIKIDVDESKEVWDKLLK